MEDRFAVAVGAGTLRSNGSGTTSFAHRWTEQGVTVETEFTGAHLLHVAVAGCVLNDVYREAAELSIPLDGVRVTAAGDFDTERWELTGIEYAVQIASPADEADIARLLERVDQVAEIPRVVRAGATVERRAP